MTKRLETWLKDNQLKSHVPSKEEILKLFRIVDRDLQDASIQALSPDRRFITAYNAALQLATIVIRAYGLRTNPNKAGHHRISIDAIPEILGRQYQNISDYFNACRIKRNICDYTNSGEVSESEAREIVEEVAAFKSAVLKWIKKTYPELFQ